MKLLKTILFIIGFSCVAFQPNYLKGMEKNIEEKKEKSEKDIKQLFLQYQSAFSMDDYSKTEFLESLKNIKKMCDQTFCNDVVKILNEIVIGQDKNFLNYLFSDETFLEIISAGDVLASALNLGLKELCHFLFYALDGAIYFHMCFQGEFRMVRCGLDEYSFIYFRKIPTRRRKIKNVEYILETSLVESVFSAGSSRPENDTKETSTPLIIPKKNKDESPVKAVNNVDELFN